MRICLLYPHLPPAVDGVGEYTCHLARELAAQGADVCVLAGSLPEGGTGGHPLLDGLRVERIAGGWGVRNLDRVVRAVRSTGCDLVSLQYTPYAYARRSLGFGMNLLPHILRARAPSKVSATLHEPWIPFEGGARRWAMASWQRLATGYMVGACHHVIVTTERRCRQVRRLLFPTGRKVAMVPVGSNVPLVLADREAVRRQLGVPGGETLFVTFGTTQPQRAYEAAYRGLRSLLDDNVACRFLSVGKITDEGRIRVLGQLEAKLGLEGRASWTGQRDAAEVSALLQAADVFLMPDRLGASTRQTTLMAALQHGLPVVAWRGPETDPLLERSGAIAFTGSGDEKGLAAAMKAFAIAPDACACMGARGRELFAEHFSWPRIAERTLTVYARG